MTVFVFTGPTLAPEDAVAAAGAGLDAVFLPPVAQGDVYRAALRRPTAIGIVDGYFERVPAVWHKEILWAMREGIHVYGCASMGALRAAELHAFGMVGVGEVFEAFLDGRLEDDDEVAVAHGTGAGYPSFSEAMVNIRATVAAATEAGVVTLRTAAELVRLAKGLFYPDRSYPHVLRRAAAEGVVDGVELAAFSHWLPGGRRDQKRDDAVAMLRLMRDRQDADAAEPNRVAFTFEHTDMWEVVRGQAGRLHGHEDGAPEAVYQDDLVDELRLRGDDSYAWARNAAMVRLLATEESRRLALTLTPSALEDAAEVFRRARGLLGPDAVADWCAAHDVTLHQWWRLVEREARLRWVREVTDSEVREGLADELRLAGAYPDLLARARQKRSLLDRQGQANPALSALAVPAGEVLRWYFCDRLGLDAVPDTAAWSLAQGFADDEAFRRALAREYCFATATATATARAGDDGRL